MKKKICILEMGGTISTLTHNPSSEFYGSPNVHISEIISELKFNHINVVTKSIAHTISHELTTREIKGLGILLNNILKSDIDGVVVTIGTNALEDIAYYIGLIVDTKKPIVFTGSHYPQGGLCFDGKLNIYNSIAIAASDDAKKLGVLITFNGHVVSARDACKSAPGFLDSFDLISASKVGEVLGGYFQLRSIPSYRHTYNSEFDFRRIKKHTKICIIYAHIGMDKDLIKSIINSGVRGIVSAGFGQGYQNKSITEMLYKASLRGLIVVRCPRLSRCFINPDHDYDNQYGFLTCNGLSAHKSSILLSTALTHEKNKDDLVRIFKEY